MSFNWEIYKELNPDLIRSGLRTKQQYDRHYMMYGKREGRKCNILQLYPDFNHDDYKNNYDDLKNMDNTQLELHWLMYGKQEGRIYNKYVPENISNDYNNYYYNKDEKIYLENMNIEHIVKFLLEKNIKILVGNGNYTSASGGISILHYFCHLLNMCAKCQVAYIVPMLNKPLNQYTHSDLRLTVHPDYNTKNVPLSILLNRNNIIVYMDSIIGNPLEQKYVCRWQLFFDMGAQIQNWHKDDLVMWYTDLYRHASVIQKFNNDIVVDYNTIKNKQINISIISNITDILSIYKPNYGNEFKKDICYTIRKRGITNENKSRRLGSVINDILIKECNNCLQKKWPSICNCKKYVGGVILQHNTDNICYRFEYPIDTKDELELFKTKIKYFYSYDPFCFSTVLAALCGCVSIVPKLEIFGDMDIYKNIPWMQYGISYGIDEESVSLAQDTLPFTKIMLKKLFYNINYDNVKCFYESIYSHFFYNNLEKYIPKELEPQKIKIFIYTNCQGHGIYSVLNKIPVFQKYFEITTMANYIILDDAGQQNLNNILNNIDVLIYQYVKDSHPNGSTQLLKKVPSHVKKISMPYLYCNWLWLFGLEIPNTMEKINEYRNNTHNNLTTNEILSNNIIDFDVVNRMENSLNIFKESDKITDIKVYDYIVNNYKNKKLFYTKNHITKTFLIYITNQVLQLLDVNVTIPETIDIGDFNTYAYHPVSEFIKNILGLNYSDMDGDEFYINFYNDYINNMDRESLNKKYHLNENKNMYL